MHSCLAGRSVWATAFMIHQASSFKVKVTWQVHASTSGFDLTHSHWTSIQCSCETSSRNPFRLSCTHSSTAASCENQRAVWLSSSSTQSTCCHLYLTMHKCQSLLCLMRRLHQYPCVQTHSGTQMVVQIESWLRREGSHLDTPHQLHLCPRL